MSINNTYNFSVTSRVALRLRGAMVWRCMAVVVILLCMVGISEVGAQNFKRSDKQLVTGGLAQLSDSLSQSNILGVQVDIDADSISRALKLSAKQAQRMRDSISRVERKRERAKQAGRLDANGNILPREPWFSDSMSLSRVCLTGAVLPGFGQIYNKQYWKLPILYTTLGASLGLAIHQNSVYKPLRREYDELLFNGMSRTEELNALQSKMISSNTKRQLFWGAAVASYIYFLGDAAVKYSTNDVSDVKKATTLSFICPGAGQIYNKSYWKVPIVIGGMVSMAYVIDWNTRGFRRYKDAYALRSDFDNNPGNYPDGVSKDEFQGRYSATYLKNLRDAYRRNRDLSIILTAAVYAFQIVDAHVDAHLKDFDVSDDLTVRLEPMFDYQYLPMYGSNPVYGVNLNFSF
ncbi:MAG: hypothetical protein IKC78_04865 [Alistipes sp.]|nr:hypothetical protein [Alistipes sp.]